MPFIKLMNICVMRINAVWHVEQAACNTDAFSRVGLGDGHEASDGLTVTGNDDFRFRPADDLLDQTG